MSMYVLMFFLGAVASGEEFNPHRLIVGVDSEYSDGAIDPGRVRRSPVRIEQRG